MEAAGHKTRKGFNLIEAAIVLAVVGGVVGGIWIAAATVIENHRVNKTVEGYLLTKQNVQNLISLAAAEQTWGCTGCLLPTAQVLQLNVFPQDWINNGAIVSPLGIGVNLFDYSLYPASYPVGTFMISTRLPKAICIKFVVALSNTNARNERISSLRGISINFPNFGYGVGSFPITPETAATACTSATSNLIYTYFPYTRINN